MMGGQAMIVVKNPFSYVPERIGHMSESNYDGSGRSVGIPTLIVSKEDGKKLIDMTIG